jgi:hypothetical protein
MLESKKSKNGVSEDFMDSGEKIIHQLSGQKHVSADKVMQSLDQLKLEFDPNSEKLINDICKCAIIEGAANFDPADLDSELRLPKNVSTV